MDYFTYLLTARAFNLVIDEVLFIYEIWNCSIYYRSTLCM